MENEPPKLPPPETPREPAPGRSGSGCRWVLLFMGLLAVAAIAFVLGMLAMRYRDANRFGVMDTSTILQQIQSVSELVTVKYVMEKVVILEDERWYGENRILLLAHGVVKAGIDLSELNPDDIQIEGTKITMVLPAERITDAYLDERRTSVIERSTGLIRQFDEDLESNARRTAIADIRSAAHRIGILDDARERARLQLKTLFLQLGFTEVEFRRPPPFRPPRAEPLPPE